MGILKKYFNLALPYIGFLFSLLVFVIYAVSTYQVIIDQPGMNGNIYWYYRLTKEVYLLMIMPLAIYSGILTAIYFRLVLSVKDSVSAVLLKHLLLLLLLVFVLEITLSILYVGKG